MPYVLRENEIIFTGDVLATDRSLERWHSFEIDAIMNTHSNARLAYYDRIEPTHNIPVVSNANNNIPVSGLWGGDLSDQINYANQLQGQQHHASAAQFQSDWSGQRYFVMPTSYGQWVNNEIGGATLTTDTIQQAIQQSVDTPVVEIPLMASFAPPASQKKRKLYPFRFKKGDIIKMRKDVLGIGVACIKCTITKQYENNQYESSPTYELLPIDKKIAKAYGSFFAYENQMSKLIEYNLPAWW